MLLPGKKVDRACSRRSGNTCSLVVAVFPDAVTEDAVSRLSRTTCFRAEYSPTILLPEDMRLISQGRNGTWCCPEPRPAASHLDHSLRRNCRWTISRSRSGTTSFLGIDSRGIAASLSSVHSDGAYLSCSNPSRSTAAGLATVNPSRRFVATCSPAYYFQTPLWHIRLPVG